MYSTGIWVVLAFIGDSFLPPISYLDQSIITRFYQSFKQQIMTIVYIFEASVLLFTSLNNPYANVK